MKSDGFHILRGRLASGSPLRLIPLVSLALMLALPASPTGNAASFETAVTAKTLPASLRREGWRLLEVPGKATADFKQDQPNRIEIRAENAVAFLYRSLGDNMGGKRRLAWRWRIDEAVPPTDLSRAPGDDRSLAVHIVFPMDISGFSFWERVEMTMTRLMAPPMAGKVLTYVWGGKQAPGSMLANPFFDSRGKIIVLHSSAEPIGRWLQEEIDFKADFLEAFGYDAPAPTYIAVSADSDDTGSRSSGVIDHLSFKN